MRAHLLDENGKITNTIDVPSLDFLPNLVDALIGGGIGDSVINGVLVPREPEQPHGPSYAEQKAVYLDEVRDLREKVLARLNGYAAMLYLKEPPAMEEEKELCETIIQGLLDITTIQPVLDATNFEDLKAAVKAEYARLVGMASEEMVKAFRKADL